MHSEDERKCAGGEVQDQDDRECVGKGRGQAQGWGKGRSRVRMSASVWEGQMQASHFDSCA